MIESMTGFGVASRQLSLGHGINATVTVECRSVNSRFLDLNIRCPEECRIAEMSLRELATKQVGRGKLEFRINLQQEESGTTSAKDLLDPQALARLAQLEEETLKHMPQAGRLRMGEVLRWPGVLQEGRADEEVLKKATLAAAQEALTALKDARHREGQALAQLITQRLDAIGAIVKRLEPLTPQIIAAHQAKLTERLTEILTGVDADGGAVGKAEVTERIRQEVVLYGVRIDVAEELGRLNTHLDSVRLALEKGGPVGKRLDFLMQELNREANTLGSKSVSLETSNASMEIKLLIEQMREQVQNLE